VYPWLRKIACKQRRDNAAEALLLSDKTMQASS
jgi:hypothetical protein